MAKLQDKFFNRVIEGKLELDGDDVIAKYSVANIEALTNKQLDSLKCGDIVCKEDSSGKHSYIVSYKKDGVGICLTYADGSGYIETVSYDYTAGHWVYNSTDVFNAKGNVTIGGNLIVKGYIQPKEFELDEDIAISSLPSGVQCYYAHARISNGKLSIVIALNCVGGVNIGALANTKIGSLALSNDILSKLYPYISTVLANKYAYLTSPSWQSTGMTKINILKGESGIDFYLSQVGDSDVGGSGDIRFEFNFLLS